MSDRFDDLVARYHKLVMSLIHRYYGGALGHRAEDLSQDVWTRLWENFKKNERNIVNFKSYLYRTVQTTMWDALRSLEKDQQLDSLEDEEEVAVESENERDIDRMALDRLLASLTDEEARMIRAHLKGFNSEEIATLTGSSEGRVRNLLTRIKKKLIALGGNR